MQEQELKRKRLSLACNVCRRKKIKCDGIRPACGKCIKLGQECSYSSNMKKRGPRQGHIEQLEQRLKKMEELMGTKSERSTNNLPIPEVLVEGQQTPQQQQTTTPVTSISHANELPSFEVLEQLIDAYFNNCATTSPILDINEFKYSVKTKTCNMFLLYSLIAVGIRFSDQADIAKGPLWLTGEKYASKARKMISHVIEVASIEHIQGLLILSSNEYGCARGPRCWTYIGMATRMAIELGLYKEKIFEEESNSILSPSKWYWYETRRKVFWESFMHDKFSSAATGRPGTLDPDDCQIMLPIDIDIFDVNSSEDFYQCSLDQTKLVHYHIRRDGITNQITGIQMNPLDVNLPEHRIYLSRVGWTSRILKAGVLLSKITQLVNREDHNTNIFAAYEDDSEYTKLNRELDEWIDSLPLQLRNTPANLERARSQNDVRSVQYILGHILHSSLIVLLNRPSIIIADMPGLIQTPQSLQDKVHRNVEKCLAAADNVTVMLKGLGCQIQVIPPYISYSVYIAATVIINNRFVMNLQENQKAESALKEYFNFLSGMKSYWAMADKLYFMVCDLYAIYQKTLSTSQGSQQAAVSSPNSSSNSSWNVNSYQTNSTMPIMQSPLTNMPLSTNDFSSNQNWNVEYNDFPSSQQQGIARSIFTDPTDLDSSSSFDIWLQQQQRQQSSEQQQQK